MKKILYPFCILSIVGAVVYVFQRFAIPIPPLINNHLNDLLILPINLFAVQYIWLLFTNKIVYVKIKMILTAIVIYTLYFECILPQFNARYTADFWDVLCYVAGGTLFWVYQHFIIKPK